MVEETSTKANIGNTIQAVVHTKNNYLAPEAETAANSHDVIDYITPGMDFQLTEVGARYYPAWNVVIRAPAVTLLSAYMRNPLYLTNLFDSKFVYFLVLEVLGKEHIMNRNYDKSKLDFAKLIYNNRVGNDKTRSDMFYHYVGKKIDDIRTKYNEIRDKGNSLQSLFTQKNKI